MESEVRKRIKNIVNDIENKRYDEASLKLISISNSVSRAKLFDILGYIEDKTIYIK